jgi:hypothetical protein
VTNVGSYSNNFSAVLAVATFPRIAVGRALPDGHSVYTRVCIELKLHILNFPRKNGKPDRKNYCESLNITSKTITANP